MPSEQPAVAQHVERGGLLGQHQRVALGEDDDAGAEQHPLGGGGHEGEVHQRVEDGIGGLHRCRGHVGIGQHDVLAGPDRVEASSSARRARRMVSAGR